MERRRTVEEEEMVRREGERENRRVVGSQKRTQSKGKVKSLNETWKKVRRRIMETSKTAWSLPNSNSLRRLLHRHSPPSEPRTSSPSNSNSTTCSVQVVMDRSSETRVLFYWEEVESWEGGLDELLDD